MIDVELPEHRAGTLGLRSGGKTPHTYKQKVRYVCLKLLPWKSKNITYSVSMFVASYTQIIFATHCAIDVYHIYMFRLQISASSGSYECLTHVEHAIQVVGTKGKYLYIGVRDM
jgi:hypothetical protein